MFLSDLGCTGTETNLLDCPSTPFIGTFCSHGRDVGVTCEGQLPVLIVTPRKYGYISS